MDAFFVLQMYYEHRLTERALASKMKIPEIPLKGKIAGREGGDWKWQENISFLISMAR